MNKELRNVDFHIANLIDDAKWKIKNLEDEFSIN